MHGWDSCGGGRVCFMYSYIHIIKYNRVEFRMKTGGITLIVV